MNQRKICTRCIMDCSDPDITFDERGRCNHCTSYFEACQTTLKTNADGQAELECIINRIQDSGKGQPYDCVIGVSGGVDSSYVAWLAAKKFGLRPLAVHFDNGWNSELAVNNVENIVGKLGIDLYTHVVDWDEFRGLQLAYLRAGVPNLEAPSDHGIWGAVYGTASRNSVKYILSGHNIVTEGILPWAWGYSPRDWRQMKYINKRFGGGTLKTFPTVSFVKYLYWTYAKRLHRLPILNYVEYNKSAVISTIEQEVGWRDYGGKHRESRFTHFFQSYMLIRRFGYDKRRAHLSTLICSGQIDRDAALAEMEKPAMTDAEIQDEKAFVIKKLGIDDVQFESLMEQPLRTFRDYPSNPIYHPDVLPKITAVVRALGLRHH